MARTLDPTLAAAQDSASRHPLVEIISNPTAPDIPFDGLILAGTAAAEKEPCTLKHSSGFVATVYVSGADLKYTRTDAAGQEFETTAITLDATIMGVSMCELTGGNIGLTYFTNEGGNYRLKRRIITPDGVAVSDAEIAFWTNTVFTSHTWVLTKGTNDYLMVYAKASGSNYYIYKRTSTDFVTWSAESAITSGLTTTNKIDNPSLIKLAAGSLWLFFDYVESISGGGTELRNIYYKTSADNGATWGAATKLTGFTGYTNMGKHPAAIQKDNGDYLILYTKEMACLQYYSTLVPISMAYGAADNSLLVLFQDGTAPVLKKIDIGTWTVTGTWSKTTTPAIQNWNGVNDMKYNGLDRVVSAGGLMPVFDGNTVIDLVDTVNDTITHYYIRTVPAWGVTKNITVSDGGSFPETIQSAVVDAVNRRLYVIFAWTPTIVIGYFDLNETGPEYTYNVVVRTTMPNLSFGPTLVVVPEVDLILLGSGTAYGSYTGWLKIFTLSTGAQYKYYEGYQGGTFPYRGVRGLCYRDGIVYAPLFAYESLYGEQDRRGMVKIDLATDVMTYHRPSWASVDDYEMKDIVPGPAGKLIISSYNHGITVYDIAADTWELYNNTTVPGLDPTGYNRLTWVDYDPANQYVFATGDSWDARAVMFSLGGALKQSNYYTGTYSGGAWSFTNKGVLVQSRTEYDAVAAADPNDTTAMFCFWQTRGNDIKWDKDGSSIDLSPYLLCDQDVATNRSIDGALNRLEFGLSHGHLFDPHNASSLLRDKIAKGRKMVVRWGESIGGVEYWDDGGTFYVTESKLAYERGKYTSVQVSAEDVRTLWSGANIVATDYYSDFPESIISDLAQQFGGMASGDISLPTFTGRSMLYHQWIDTALDEIINQICERYGHFVRITPDNKLSARRISDTAAVDHVYTDTGTIIRFEPDDKYSDFTNRVTVVGTERSYIEVQYTEERVGSLNGTVGWYGYKNDFEVRYSEDKSRTCINPRLVVLETSTSIAFELAGKISESISYVDPNDKYCVVTVEAPDLVPMFVTALFGLVGTYYLPDMVVGIGGGKTIRVGSALTAIQTFICFSILSAIGNFQYEIWATPTGRIRRTVQGTADDTAHQNSLGRVVPRRIEDPLCYSVSDCSTVASQELLVSRLQRGRVKLSKIAHLRDEEGDTIQIPHPYTGAPLKLFVTDINRRFKKSPGPDGEGYIIDDIEGWVLS